MNKKISILGAGESGTGTAILAKKMGFGVFVTDAGEILPKYKAQLEKHGIEFEENTHSFNKISNSNLVVKSPGIPENAMIIEKIKTMDIPVISEIEFAGRYTNAFTICITGSNGKTTTTLMIYDLLKSAGLNVGLAGNVGHSFALQVAMGNFDYYVIELSSFQLDGMSDFRADIAVLLNITPDHLDRYGYKFENYVQSKFRITQNQTPQQYFIYCIDDGAIVQNMGNMKGNPTCIPFSIKKELEQGGYVNKQNEITIKHQNNSYTMAIHDFILRGNHNVYNSMAAAISGSLMDLRNETIRECLTNFQGVEHRLEPVLRKNGIEFINDSKATNINSTWYALESMNTPVVWIVGGIDKGNDYNELLGLVKEKVKAIVCLGKDNRKLHKAFGKVVETMVNTQSMKDAVKSSFHMAKEGDTVLLSPACASFDLFDNYEDRGWQFKEYVREL